MLDRLDQVDLLACRARRIRPTTAAAGPRDPPAGRARHVSARSSSPLVGPWSSIWTCPRAARAPTSGPRSSCAVHARARSRLSVRIFAQPSCAEMGERDGQQRSCRPEERALIGTQVQRERAPPPRRRSAPPGLGRPRVRSGSASRLLVARSCRSALTPSMDRTMSARFTPTPRAAATNQPVPGSIREQPDERHVQMREAHLDHAPHGAGGGLGPQESAAESSSIAAISRIVRSLSGRFRALCTQPDIERRRGRRTHPRAGRGTARRAGKRWICLGLVSGLLPWEPPDVELSSVERGARSCQFRVCERSVNAYGTYAPQRVRSIGPRSTVAARSCRTPGGPDLKRSAGERISIGEEVGRALRRARLARGLTLRQVGERSLGAFKPTAVAGYERAERTISLERFYALCLFYGVAPTQLLAEVEAVARRSRPRRSDPGLKTRPRTPAGPGRSPI